MSTLLPSPQPHPVKKLLAERGIQHRQIAKDLDYNVMYFGRLLNGYHPITPDLAARVSRYLGVPVHRLFHNLPMDEGECLQAVISEMLMGLRFIAAAVEQAGGHTPALALLQAEIGEYRKVISDQIDGASTAA